MTATTSGYDPAVAAQRSAALKGAFSCATTPDIGKAFSCRCPWNLGSPGPGEDRGMARGFAGKVRGAQVSFADGHAVVLHDPQSIVLTSCVFDAGAGMDALRQLVRAIAGTLIRKGA